MNIPNPFAGIMDTLRACQARTIEERAPQSHCDACGKDFPAGHVVWLEGPYDSGLWLCHRHYEEELTDGRGRR